MKWYLAGETFSFPVVFTLAGEYVTPDEGSLRVTLRDPSGAIQSGIQNLLVTDSTPISLTSLTHDTPLLGTASLTVDAALNAITAPLFESRFLTISYTVNGAPRSTHMVYRLHHFIPLQALTDEVRDLLGAQEQELPDEDIDLVESYYSLLNSEGSDFQTSMQSSGMAAVYANKAVAAFTALGLMPSLPARLLKVETSHNSTMERMAIDFNRLQLELESTLTEALLNMRKAVNGSTTTSAGFSHLVLSSPTDVITGA